LEDNTLVVTQRRYKSFCENFGTRGIAFAFVSTFGVISAVATGAAAVAAAAVALPTPPLPDR